MFILIRHLKNCAFRYKIVHKTRNHCIINIKGKLYIACISDIKQLERSICGMSYFLDLTDLTPYNKGIKNKRKVTFNERVTLFLYTNP